MEKNNQSRGQKSCLSARSNRGSKALMNKEGKRKNLVKLERAGTMILFIENEN